MRGKAFRRERTQKFLKSRAREWTILNRFTSDPDWRKNVENKRWFAGLGKHKLEYSRKDIGGRLDHKKFLRDLDRWNKKLMLEEASKFPHQFDEDYYDYYNTAA